MVIEREGAVMRVVFDAGAGLNVMTQGLLGELGSLFAGLWGRSS
jgi:hypothetical protein